MKRTGAKVSPPHLRPATRRWFEEVLAEYQLESHHVRLLTLAAEAWDRCAAARVVLDRDGISYIDRFEAPRARPEVAVERDSRIAFARILRELALDIAAPDDSHRPPQITRGAR